MYSIFHSGTLYLTLENRASNMHWHIRLNLPLSHALCGEALSCSITLEPEFSSLVKYSACRQQWLGIIFPYCSSEICALSDLWPLHMCNLAEQLNPRLPMGGLGGLKHFWRMVRENLGTLCHRNLRILSALHRWVEILCQWRGNGQRACDYQH